MRLDRKFMAAAMALMICAAAFAGNRTRDEEITSWSAEFQVRFSAGGVERVYRTIEKLHPGSAEDAEGVYEFLCEEITDDSYLQKEIAEVYGLSVNDITIVSRKVIERYNTGDWVENFEDGCMSVHKKDGSIQCYDTFYNLIYDSNHADQTYNIPFSVTVQATVEGKTVSKVFGRFFNYVTAQNVADCIEKGLSHDMFSVDSLRYWARNKTGASENAPVTFKCECEELDFSSLYSDDNIVNNDQVKYTVFVKVYVDDKTFNYGKWSTFDTLDGALDACAYASEGEGSKEITSWAVMQADNFEPGFLYIHAYIVVK